MRCTSLYYVLRSAPFGSCIIYIIYNNNIIQYIKLYIFYVFFHQTKGLQRHEYQAVGKLKLSAPTSSSFQVGPSSLKRAHKLFQYIRGTVVRWTLLQDSSSFAALPVTCVTHRLRKLQSHEKKKKISLSLAELASSHLITLSVGCYKCNLTFSNPLGHSVSCGTRTHNTSRVGCFLMLCPLCNGSALMHLAPWCLRLSSSGCLLLRFSGRNLTVTNLQIEHKAAKTTWGRKDNGSWWKLHRNCTQLHVACSGGVCCALGRAFSTSLLNLPGSYTSGTSKTPTRMLSDITRRSFRYWRIRHWSSKSRNDPFTTTLAPPQQARLSQVTSFCQLPT